MRQLLIEAIEGAAPATLMPVALLDRLEWGLAEGQQSLPVLLGEGHRHHGFKATLALFIPGEGEDDTGGLDDLAEHATVPQLLAGFGRPQAGAPRAAGPDVHLHQGGGIVLRPPPVPGVTSIAPRLEDHAARRIEDAGDDQFTRRGRRRAGVCRHGALLTDHRACRRPRRAAY